LEFLGAVVAATTLRKATQHKAILVVSGPHSRLLNIKHPGARWPTSGTLQEGLKELAVPCQQPQRWRTLASPTMVHPEIGAWLVEVTGFSMRVADGD
jgi:hypothetical protein